MLSRLTLATLLALLAALPAAAEIITSVSDLLADKARYDHQWMCLVGKATDVDPEISKVLHHQFWTAWLHDGPARVVLWSYGLPPFKNDEEIEACGFFTRWKKARSTGEIFKDEFNVTRILRGPLIRAGRVIVTAKGIETAPWGAAAAASGAQAPRAP